MLLKILVQISLPNLFELGKHPAIKEQQNLTFESEKDKLSKVWEKKMSSTGTLEILFLNCITCKTDLVVWSSLCSDDLRFTPNGLKDFDLIYKTHSNLYESIVFVMCGENAQVCKH